MIKTNTAATVFNYYDNRETGKEEYHVTHLRDVRWENVTATNVTLTGTVPSAAIASTTQLLVWPDVNADGKTWVSPRVYARMTQAEALRHWTLRDGQDYIAKGIVTAPDVIARPNDVAGDAEEIMRVQSAASYTFGRLPHWEISGVNA